MGLFFEDEIVEEQVEKVSKYSTKAAIPQYTPTDYCPSFSEMMDLTKYEQLVREINEAPITDEEKRFLRLAASRHIVFNYAKVADYYANSNKEIQKLLENSAMVIVDINNALANGFAKMDSRLLDIIEQSKETKE